MYDKISEKDKKKFIAEVLTIQELQYLMSFRNDDEHFQKEFIRLWKEYQEKNFQRSFLD